jgi:hypothetical protein
VLFGCNWIERKETRSASNAPRDWKEAQSSPSPHVIRMASTPSGVGHNTEMPNMYTIYYRSEF